MEYINQMATDILPSIGAKMVFSGPARTVVGVTEYHMVLIVESVVLVKKLLCFACVFDLMPHQLVFWAHLSLNPTGACVQLPQQT
jgi:hypothetical protein